MVDDPWLTILGVGEDGVDGLTPAALRAVQNAVVIMGAERHLHILQPVLDTLDGAVDGRCQTWPVPFADGVEKLLAHRGKNVVMLASGDPFWFGSGAVIAPHLQRHEWRVLPGISVFSLVAGRLGWPLQSTICVGLHAAPLATLRRHLADGVRMIVLLRDGAAVLALAQYLVELGIGASSMCVMEAVGGPHERVRETTAAGYDLADVRHPVSVAVTVARSAPGKPTFLSGASGLADTLFEHDGQMTKRLVRAMTLSTLAPVGGELLWDIGAGSGSISIEWLLAHPACRAIAIEADPVRAARVRDNADRLGVAHLKIVVGLAPAALAGLEAPQAVFIGGGLSDELLEALWRILPRQCRIVANAVTLESEAVLTAWQSRTGGSLQRLQLSEAVAIGGRRGWQSGFPIVQWSVTR